MSRLELEHVSVVARQRELISDVSLAVEPGELVVLVGPNGAGKTTLLRTALGLVRPSRGHARLDGRDVREIPPRERAGAVAWLPQMFATSEALSVLEVVSAARFRFDEPAATSLREAEKALARCGAEALAEARVTELSGGERQRVGIASVLAQGSRLVLLDEPASHLDPAQQLETYRLLGELWSSGLGLLLVTHDVNLLGTFRAAERIVIIGLSAGRMLFRSTFLAPDLPARLADVFGVRFATLAHEDRRILLPHAREVSGQRS